MIFRLLFDYRNSKLEKEVFGIRFKNPVGLAAGFDKEAQFVDEFASLGFGFIEIGTITPKGQIGPPKTCAISCRWWLPIGHFSKAKRRRS